jgi:hypothetical protein
MLNMNRGFGLLICINGRLDLNTIRKALWRCQVRSSPNAANARKRYTTAKWLGPAYGKALKNLHYFWSEWQDLRLRL